MNESMLTGESIPVSKSSITNEQLACIDFETFDPLKTPEMGRYFLFSGTRVIRSRTGKFGNRSLDDSDDFLNMRSATEPGALAMCARVGFNTTKGSLVRSMLFPKPNKFQFYRDSWRFIGVLAIIASFGFMGLIYYNSSFILQFFAIEDWLATDHTSSVRSDYYCYTTCTSCHHGDWHDIRHQ